MHIKKHLTQELVVYTLTDIIVPPNLTKIHHGIRNQEAFFQVKNYLNHFIFH